MSLKEKINTYAIDGDKFNIKIVPIDYNFMNLLPILKTLEKEREIMNSVDFKNTVGSRIIFPEHTFPEYTLLNHSKIDILCSLIDSNKINYDEKYLKNQDEEFDLKRLLKQFVS